MKCFFCQMDLQKGFRCQHANDVMVDHIYSLTMYFAPAPDYLVIRFPMKERQLAVTWYLESMTGVVHEIMKAGEDIGGPYYTSRELLRFKKFPNITPENVQEKIKLYLTLS